MTEVLFYHLQSQPLERVLPQLLERSVERGWRVVVQAGSEERVDALDSLLWTYRDDTFLPHGTARDGEAAAQPILLTTADHNPNAATVRFLIDGVPMPPDAKPTRVSCCCSMARTRRRSPPRGRAGARPRHRGLR